MPKCYISIRDVTAHRIEGGAKIIVTTDIPSHLFMRWTLVPPKAHTIPIQRRGVFHHADRRFCFDTYHDNEQEEAGNTLVHSFRKTPWAYCECRYFYFWGKVGDTVCESDTPCFQLHLTAPPLGPEQTKKFYCDYDPETSSVDGYAYKDDRPLTWAQLRNDAGTGSIDSHENMILRLYSWTSPDEWYYLSRIILTFDTRELRPWWEIVSARLGAYGSSKAASAAWRLAPAVYQSYPLSDTALVPADYNRTHDALLSDVITYDDIDPDDWNVWTLNPAGLLVIDKGGITRLALKDSAYDAPNTPPPWENFRQCGIIFKTAEFGVHNRQPYLEVTYRELDP